jgi:hypothetical protein
LCFPLSLVSLIITSHAQSSQFRRLPPAVWFSVAVQILLLFAWFVSIANKQPVFPEWRRKAFRCGLFAATGVTAWFFAFCLHFLRVGESAQRCWLFMNWLGIVVWMLCLTASLAGKGAGRILLFAWGIMIFVGVFGIDSASIPGTQELGV